jgi:hypothetical protein
LGLDSIDVLGDVERRHPPVDGHEVGPRLLVEAGHGSLDRVRVPAVAVDDEDVAESGPDEILEDIIDVFLKDLRPDGDRARELRDTGPGHAVVDGRGDEGVALGPDLLGDLERDVVIGADGAGAVRFDRPDGQNDPVGDGGDDFGHPHPGEFLQFVELEVFDRLLGEAGQDEAQDEGRDKKISRGLHLRRTSLVGLRGDRIPEAGKKGNGAALFRPLVADGGEKDRAVEEKDDPVLELQGLEQVHGGVHEPFVLDLLPEVAAEEAEGQDDLGQGETLLPADPAELGPSFLDLLVGVFFRDPFAELAVDAVSAVVELPLVEIPVGRKPRMALDVLQIPAGELDGVRFDEMDKPAGRRCRRVAAGPQGLDHGALPLPLKLMPDSTAVNNKKPPAGAAGGGEIPRVRLLLDFCGGFGLLHRAVRGASSGG